MNCSGPVRALIDDPMCASRPWKGSDIAWIVTFQAHARRRYGGALRRVERPGQLTYLLALPVIGRDEPVTTRVELHRDPVYSTYGLEAVDYPRVFADEGAQSPHRMPDDSLCLYYPGDPKSHRWTADQGLNELLNLTARHLFAEDYWRENDGVWPFDEADHGYRGAA
jgi:hypothetical protein